MKRKLAGLVTVSMIVVQSIALTAFAGDLVKTERIQRHRDDMTDIYITHFDELGLVERVNEEGSEQAVSISYEYDGNGNPTGAVMEIPAEDETVASLVLQLENRYEGDTLTQVTGRILDPNGNQISGADEATVQLRPYIQTFEKMLRSYTGYTDCIITIEAFSTSVTKENGQVKSQTEYWLPNMSYIKDYDEQDRLHRYVVDRGDTSTVMIYAYDELGRVEYVDTEEIDADQNAESREYSPVYEESVDEDGNLVYTDPSYAYVINSEGQILAYTEPQHEYQYTYDSEGRMICENDRYRRADGRTITNYEYY